MARFDDRLHRGTDGDDFQRFVWEALRSGHFDSLLAGRYVRPYFASGNDGAIDHVAIGKQDQIVFECKFFGKERDGEPSDDWTNLSRRLRVKLCANAARAHDEVGRLYKPWFVTDRPIKGYWFCTSGRLSPGAQVQLRDAIKDFFAKIARDHSSLAHLAEIDVEVLGWNDFEGALAAKPAMHFRWFRKFPVGLRPLKSITEGKTFRKFLDEGTLPFFSRGAFNREIGFDNKARLTDEQSILSTLLDENDSLGLVLSGPGGLGKTRLAVQLGLAAEERNWLVLQVERNTPGEAIEELAREHASPTRVLLIVDYAEAAKYLVDLAQAMQRCNREGGHRFRFVATCRTSALSAVKEALEESPWRPIEFSGEPDDRYANWVVSKILASVEVPGADDIAPICAGVPVLATFAVFLFEQYREDFDAQFGQIHRGENFAEWADKRLKLALTARGLDDQTTRRPLASLAARFPLSAAEYCALRGLNDESVRLLDLLRADRWIESEGGEIAAAHDIFADVIVSRYVFEAPLTITDRAGDVLIDAIDASGFDRAFIGLGRLAAHQLFKQIDGLEIIKRAYSRSPSAVIAAPELLLKIRLPDERTCICILDALPEVADAVARDMSCDGLVSYLAEATATWKEDGWREKATLILQPFLDRAVDRPHRSNMVVRRALRLLPTRYRDRALAWIRREPTRSETHFLLVAWLLSGLPLDEIATDVDLWLGSGGRTDSASFVLAAWLDAAAKLDSKETAAKIAMVETHVLGWLDTHGKTEVARFVYQSWLDAAAKLDPKETAAKIAMVETHVLGWLDTHGKTKVAGFVYQSWLDAAAKLDPKETAAKIAMVETHVLGWLDTHGKTKVAGFVYPPWLDAAAKLDSKETAAKIAMVETRVLGWLDTHGKTEVARFVYQSWLDAAAKLDPKETAAKIAMVETHVLGWLDTHGKTEVARFVYQSWLDAAAKLDSKETAAKIAMVETRVLGWLDTHGKTEVTQFLYKSWLDAAAKLDSKETAAKIATVETRVLGWLDTHGKTEVARFVYKSWLDAAAKLDSKETAPKIATVETHVLGWLDSHGASKDAGFVFRSWNEAGGDFELVRTGELSWLKQNTNNVLAGFVWKYPSKRRDLPADAIADVIAWCWNFPDNIDAVFRIAPILSHYAVGPLDRPLIDTAILVLEKVQLERFSDSAYGHAALSIIGTIAWKTRFYHDINARVDAIHANIFRLSSVYSESLFLSTPVFALNPSLAQHLADMVERNVIDPKVDQNALERFANWLAAWPIDRKEFLRSAILALEQNCPIPGLWGRVGVTRDQPDAPSSGTNGPDLEKLLDQLRDLQMRPHDWSNLWEKEGWKHFPGEPRLVVLAQQWLVEAVPDPSWPYVWQPLFLFFPNDQHLVDVALWWLEHRAPRDRGAWVFVWKLLWDENRARERLGPLGDAWLKEFETGQHKYWHDVRTRLDAAK